MLFDGEFDGAHNSRAWGSRGGWLPSPLEMQGEFLGTQAPTVRSSSSCRYRFGLVFVSVRLFFIEALNAPHLDLGFRVGTRVQK